MARTKGQRFAADARHNERAGLVLGPREAARENLDVVRSGGSPARAAEIGRERRAEREVHTERTIESGGKGGQALLVAFVLFAGWLFLTGRIQAVWDILLYGPSIEPKIFMGQIPATAGSQGAPPGGAAPVNPMGPGYRVRPRPGAPPVLPNVGGYPLQPPGGMSPMILP